MESTTPADDLDIAQRRAENLAQRGGTVVGFSLQAFAAGLSVLWVLLAATLLPGDLIWFLLATAGAIVSVASWVWARLTQTLLPYRVEGPERPMAVLGKRQRDEIARQIRGRESSTPLTAPLVRAMLLWQRRSTRVALPPLIGTGLSLIGLGGSRTHTDQGWSVAVLGLELAAVVVITTISMVEARRRTRVVTDIEASTK